MIPPPFFGPSLPNTESGQHTTTVLHVLTVAQHCDVRIQVQCRCAIRASAPTGPPTRWYPPAMTAVPTASRGYHKDAHPLTRPFSFYGIRSLMFGCSPEPEVPQLVVVLHFKTRGRGVNFQYMHRVWLRCFFVVLFMYVTPGTFLDPNFILSPSGMLVAGGGGGGLTARGGTGHLGRTETQRGRLWTA